MKKVYISIGLIILIVGIFVKWFVFKDSTTSKALNDMVDKSAEIVCYSGGKEIYSGHSTGKVYSENGSDGWFFKDKDSGHLMEISADCIMKY